MRRVWDSRRVAIALLVLYGAATLFATLHHEPWRDEAETWLVARDLPLTDTLTWTRHVGGPALWPALVLPFARAGAPYITQALINWLLAMAMAALFLLRAPFSLPTKALFLASFYPAYQYAVIARTYALGTLLLFAVVAFHASRHARPIAYAILVALLANANPHSGAAAFAATSWFAFELLRMRNREARQWLAVLVMILGMAIAVVQMTSFGYFIPPNVVSAPYFGAFFEATGGAFLPLFENSFAMYVSLGILLFFLWSCRRSAPALWLAAWTLGGLAFIFTYLWIAGYRHYGLVLMATIAALWLAAESAPLSKSATALLNVVLALSIILTIRFASADLTRNFSGSREMAAYIERAGLGGRELAAHPPPHCEAVLPYLRQRTLYYAALGEHGSYMKWDRAYRIAQATRSQVIAERAAKHYGQREWLFLSAQPLDAPEQFGLRLLYATREPLVEPRDARQETNDERYWLYATRP